jgi:hypothetical protein
VLDLNLHHFVESAEIRGRIKLFTDWNLLLQGGRGVFIAGVVFSCLLPFIILFVCYKPRNGARCLWLRENVSIELD